MKLHNLEIGYRTDGNTVSVASGINASLTRGQLTCLLGPNGAGKSTLLRTLSGFQPPLGGDIEIDGKPLASYPMAELARKISIVLTDRIDLQNMTVGETVALGRSPYTGFFGRLSADDHRIVGEAMDSVGITPLQTRRISTLSDGERQKVMIAKALAQQTPIILLDEPTSFLDFPSKVDTMLLLRRMAREQNKAIFLSTHDLETAFQTADRLWLIDRGKGLAIGSLRQLAADGAIARYFNSDAVRFNADSLHFDLSNI